MVIVIDEKKYFKSKDEFLDMVSDIEELYKPLTFSDKSKEISKDEFKNYCIWKWLNKEVIEFEFDRYNNFFVVWDNIPEDGIVLLAESDDLYFCVWFYDAG